MVSVADVRKDRGEPRPVHIEAPVEWQVELTRVEPEPPLVADLELSHVSGGVLARGSVATTVTHTCHRCLSEQHEEIEIEVAQLYVDAASADHDDYELTGDQLDLEPMLRDEVLLALPLVPSCGEACPGLVDDHQTDLNDASREPGDADASPFAVLKDLLNQHPPRRL